MTGSLPKSGPTTVAFESIDGPPVAVFDKLVAALAEEANARRVAVISRKASPDYRVRAYLAVHIVRKQPRVGWVWDVYDSDMRRMLRISGEEAGMRQARDGWGAADGEVLRRIARNGMDRLAGLVGSAQTPERELPSAPLDGSEGTMIAAAPAPGRSSEISLGSVPLPPRRPQRAAEAAQTRAEPLRVVVAVR
jgi:hypothetical protein